jgi:hypothetical protein
MRVLLCAWLLPWVAKVVGGAEQDSEATSAYFAEYGSITDHISMLVDAKRMSAYHDAIMNRAEEDNDVTFKSRLEEPEEGTTAWVDMHRCST